MHAFRSLPAALGTRPCARPNRTGSVSAPGSALPGAQCEAEAHQARRLPVLHRRSDQGNAAGPAQRTNRVGLSGLAATQLQLQAHSSGDNVLESLFGSAQSFPGKALYLNLNITVNGRVRLVDVRIYHVCRDVRFGARLQLAFASVVDAPVEHEMDLHPLPRSSFQGLISILHLLIVQNPSCVVKPRMALESDGPIG